MGVVRRQFEFTVHTVQVYLPNPLTTQHDLGQPIFK